MKQLIGQFEVTSLAHHNQKVIVFQDIIADESGVVVSARKVFTLNTEDGEEVNRTSDPRIFLKEDGTVLKKVGYFKITENF
ncbi:hypothetical protein [Desulfopila aestuarii]|uniref:Uncharacterized protein n=1 Tax=Desulfopila aestuarii DSM 18488 TaxID=1121416 RepID=A0A1M7Y8S4_9BACT|nr:hypothetical protein [Desulfopila aestuarii]SHO49009.1 hypothetical protein SAMN02745220_02611 [Desulfopila aestuarii DSM 18488]